MGAAHHHAVLLQMRTRQATRHQAAQCQEAPALHALGRPAADECRALTPLQPANMLFNMLSPEKRSVHASPAPWSADSHAARRQACSAVCILATDMRLTLSKSSEGTSLRLRHLVRTAWGGRMATRIRLRHLSFRSTCRVGAQEWGACGWGTAPQQIGSR